MAEKTDNKKTIKKQILPVLALRGLVVFPHMIIHFDVGREKSVKALEHAMMNDQLIFLSAQKDFKKEDPEPQDIYSVGTISRVKQLLRLPGDTIRVLVEGVNRAQIEHFTSTEPFFEAEVAEKYNVYGNIQEEELEALKRQVVDVFEDYARLSSKISPESVMSIMSLTDNDQLCDIIAGNISTSVDRKQDILSKFNLKDRYIKLLEIMYKEIEILQIERDIAKKVRSQIDKMQKEYYLREQLKAIQNELGDKDGIMAEVEEYRRKLETKALPEEVYAKASKEIDRLSKMQSSSPESAIIRTYLDLIFDLPWYISTEEKLDLQEAQKILDEDHYGLEKVKERIIEYLSIRKLKNSLKGPILCLVGPPGVGKTSIAKSVAKALNRNYVRLSLGGVRDEADIRGHRRTYIGAMPGRIINALKQAGSNNPLILLDEIDKMSSDFRGDPAAAMLEVLDSEQNYAFRDHYLELPFDLSNIMFITTANNLDTVPRPLLDRMEVINIAGYTEEEKANIAIRHLIPKQIQAHGLKKTNIKIEESAVRDIINYYTREAGVRNLEREIASVCRKCARMLVNGQRKTIKVTSANIEKILGVKKYRYEKAQETDEIGIATGLAWTPAGGDTLFIEVNVMKGNGKLELTGHLGDIMKESARTAISYIRSRACDFGLDPDFYNKVDIHIHVPEGAVPKDGPSAGITLATAMISALTGIPVKRNVAMTGEITLRGRVLPIGGLKEKILAARRAGIDTVIIPVDNKKDLEDIPENVLDLLDIIAVKDMNKVLNIALKGGFNKQKGVFENELQAIPTIPSEDAVPKISDICSQQGVIEQ